MSTTDEPAAFEIFTTPPPASPNPRRCGADEGGGSAITPVRPSKAPAIVRTHSLPAGFGMGTINVSATDTSVSELTGKDLPQGILTDKAIVKSQKKYVGRKRNAGAVAMLLAKGEDKSVQSMCFYTPTPRPGRSARRSPRRSTRSRRSRASAPT